MKKNSKTTFHRKVHGKKGLVARDEVPERPMQLTDQLQTTFTLRFLTTLLWTGSYTVTWQNLLDAWFVAGTATTAYQLFDFVKVKKVIVRGMGAADPAVPLAPTASVGVEFPGLVGGQFGSGKQVQDVAIGATKPAMVVARPDRGSQAAQFQPSTANAAFIIRATDGERRVLVGAVIDVIVTYKNSGDISPAALGTARAGLAPGNLYFGGLDGLATANTTLKSCFIPIA